MEKNNPDLGYNEDIIGQDFNVLDTNTTKRDTGIKSIYDTELQKAEVKKLEKEGNFSSYLGLIGDVDKGSTAGVNIDNRASLQGEGADIRDIYSTLTDGTLITRYEEGYFVGEDNEDIYAQQQSNLDKAVKGHTKFMGKTLNNVVGGTLGMAYGAISAIGQGNWERVYDNEFFDFLDDQNTKLDNFQANYRAQEERDLGFIDSAQTVNFWADDFLGGLSFMAGTVISEGLWAWGTGGSSLSTAAGRVALRGSKYYGTAAKLLTKGVKEGTKTYQKYARLDRLNKARQAVNTAGWLGKAGDLARFTYTGAGFEAGMEARLYQREQKDNFYNDFEKLNGRQPTAEERSEFEENLDSTTNTLWATNMALVGASNFAILGKPLGISSPFKLPKSSLNKVIFGVGEEIAEEGGKKIVKAITKTKLQQGLGLARGLLKNPLMEGVVEEGGQAVASTAMEEYLTSRYNPSKKVASMMEGVYDGFAHTYGTKEGWKEVGLGMLIGFFGGEATSFASNRVLFKDAKEGLQKQDGHAKYYAQDDSAPGGRGKELSQDEAETYQGKVITDFKGSVGLAADKNSNTGEALVSSMTAMNRTFAQTIEDRIGDATQLEKQIEEREEASKSGDLNKVASSDHKIMMTSAQRAVAGDYVEQQLADFRTALEMEAVAEEGGTSELAKTYGIEQSAVKEQINKLVGEFETLTQTIEKNSSFAEYLIPDNLKELGEGLTQLDAQHIRASIVYQMGMAEFYEKNSKNVIDSIQNELSEINPALAKKAQNALTAYDRLKKAGTELTERKNKIERALNAKKANLAKVNVTLVSENPEGREKSVRRKERTVAKLETEIRGLNTELTKVDTDISDKVGSLQGVSYDTQTRNLNQLGAELDAIDPLASSEGLVEASTVEKTLQDLKEIEESIENQGNPQVAAKVKFLVQQYQESISMWERNAQTIQDISNPEFGLKKIKRLVKGKKEAGTTTLEFLKRLQNTVTEEQKFAADLKRAMTPIENETDTEIDDNNQDKVDKDLGDRTVVGEESPIGLTPVQEKLRNLKQKLIDLVQKENPYLVNGSQDIEKVLDDKKPTLAEIEEYNELRKDFKAGDINKILGRDPYKEGNDGGISKSVKKRSGLTNEQIARYQELSEKFVDWRVITGSTDGRGIQGTSIFDILENTDRYEKQTDTSDTKKTTGQLLEILKTAENKFKIGKTNTNIAQTMTYINIAKAGDDYYNISHLGMDEVLDQERFGIKLESFEESYYNENGEEIDDNIWTLSKEGKTVKVTRSEGNNRINVATKDLQTFLDMLGMEQVGMDNKSSWMYLYKDGKIAKTSWGIESTNGEKLHPETIYDMKEGDEVTFVVDTEDGFNIREVLPLLEEYRKLDKNSPEALKVKKAIKAKIAIYNKTADGKTFGLTKWAIGRGNFEKLREAAWDILLEQTSDNVSKESLVRDRRKTQFKLPYKTTVQKVFVGTPNLTLDKDSKVVVHKPSQKGWEKFVVGTGYSVKGNLGIKDDNIRTTFISEDTNTPYVIIQQGNSKIAYPVEIATDTESIVKEVEDILDNNELSEIRKESEILKVVDPSITGVLDLSTNEGINNLKNSIRTNGRVTYSKETIRGMSSEEFREKTEITIDLDGSESLFVSPKVATNLNKTMEDTDTNLVIDEAPITKEEKDSLREKYSVELAKAKGEKAVAKMVSESGDELLQRLYDEDGQFKKDLQKQSDTTKAVPSIYTKQTAKEYLESVIDLGENGIPKSLQNLLGKNLDTLKENPTTQELEKVVREFMKVVKDHFKVVDSKIDTDNLYHISTFEEQDSIGEDFVRVFNNFYKKVDKNLTEQELLEGLYNKYLKGTLPSHMNFEGNLTFEQFKNNLPQNKEAIYKKYYNTQPRVYQVVPLNRTEALPIDEYLKEDYLGDFKVFKDSINPKDDLYIDVLSHLDATKHNIEKQGVLTREVFDNYKEELGKHYDLLLEYSLINKHIDLQETPKGVIFAENEDTQKRISAVNSPKLTEVKGNQVSQNEDGSISVKSTRLHIKHDGKVYEKYGPKVEGKNRYVKIADFDPNFYTFDVVAPFSNETNESTSEVTKNKVDVRKTKGEDKIDC